MKGLAARPRPTPADQGRAPDQVTGLLLWPAEVDSFTPEPALDRNIWFARARLATAERGRYTRWSLRGVDEAVIDRWFTRRGKAFDLDPDIRSAVEFRYLNLAEDRYPSLSSGVWGMDLVVCRNVLIYFDKDTVTRVARRLVSSMREEGWLLLGASDPAVSSVTHTSVELTRAGIAYRRADPDAPRPSEVVLPEADPPATFVPDVAPSPPAEEPFAARPPHAADEAPIAPPTAPSTSEAAPAPEVADELVARAYAAHDYDRVAAIAAETLAAGQGNPAVYVYWVRALANQGRLEEADRVCSKGLETWRDSAELSYLRSVLLLHANRPREASVSARQALYIDRGSIVAHLALADARMRLGERASAGVALTNALRLLRALPEGTVVPASDGEVSHRMREMVAARLRLLRNAA
jgi:chemotaxis protein methyltransferase CheR